MPAAGARGAGPLAQADATDSLPHATNSFHREPPRATDWRYHDEQPDQAAQGGWCRSAGIARRGGARPQGESCRHEDVEPADRKTREALAREGAPAHRVPHTE